MRSLPTIAALAAVIATSPAYGSLWTYVYQGHLAAGSMLGGTTLSVPTAFTLNARFDDSSANLAAPVGVAGFVAYAPIRATLTVGGARYVLQSWNGTSGIAVSIFDETTPFGGGHVASGIIQNVPADGAGIVGDWLKSTGKIFVGGNLQPFTMTYADFFGVGFGAGPCATCITPISATLGGVGTAITLPNGSFTYKDYPFAGPPFTPYHDFVWLTRAPEPGALAMFGIGALGIVATRRRSKG